MTTFNNRETVPPPKTQAVRVIGRSRELGTRLARAEADEWIEGRRKEVYDNPDAKYAPETSAVLPPVGSKKRAELVERIRQLKAEKVSHLNIANQLGIELHQVSMLCRRHEIGKG